MQLRAHPAAGLRGTTGIPGDKSVSHRALLLGAMAVGTSRSPDCSRAPTCSRPPPPLVPWASTSNGTAMASGRSTALASAGWPRPTGPRSRQRRHRRQAAAGPARRPSVPDVLTGDDSLRARGRWAGSSRRCRRWARASSHAAAAGCPRGGRHHRAPADPLPQPVASAQVKSAVLLAGLHAAGGPRWSSRSRRATTPSACSATSAPRSRSTDQEDGTRAVSVLQPELAAATIVVPEISRRRHFREARPRVPERRINPLRTGLLDCLEEMGARIRIEPHPEPGGEPIADLLIEAGRSPPSKCRPSARRA